MAMQHKRQAPGRDIHEQFSCVVWRFVLLYDDFVLLYDDFVLLYDGFDCCEPSIYCCMAIWTDEHRQWTYVYPSLDLFIGQQIINQSIWILWWFRFVFLIGHPPPAPRRALSRWCAGGDEKIQCKCKHFCNFFSIQ